MKLLTNTTNVSLSFLCASLLWLLLVFLLQMSWPLRRLFDISCFGAPSHKPWTFSTLNSLLEFALPILFGTLPLSIPLLLSHATLPFHLVFYKRLPWLLVFAVGLLVVSLPTWRSSVSNVTLPPGHAP